MAMKYATAALFCSGLALGAEVGFTPSVRFSYFSGHTAYEIRGEESLPGLTLDWRSRLKFPINNLRLDADMTVEIPESIDLVFGWWTTLDREAGTMRDDDYIEDIKYVWSRSDAELDAWGLAGSVKIWLLDGESFSLGPTLGFAYDRFDYDIYDVRQFALSPDDRATVNGLVLTYSQEQLSLPIGLAAKWRPAGWFELSSSVAASFLTYVWDEDDHVLRSKVSKNEGLAVSVPISVTADFIVADTVRLGVWGEYFFMRTYGAKQRQRFYDGPYEGMSFNDVEADVERQSFAVGARLAIDL